MFLCASYCCYYILIYISWTCWSSSPHFALLSYNSFCDCWYISTYFCFSFFAISQSNTALSFLSSALSSNWIASWYFYSSTFTNEFSTFWSTSAIGFLFPNGLEANCYWLILCLLIGGKFSLWLDITLCVFRPISSSSREVLWIQIPTPFYWEDSCAGPSWTLPAPKLATPFKFWSRDDALAGLN